MFPHGHRRSPTTGLILAFAALLAVPACGPDGGAGGPRPNVLLVVLDTTRADFLSSYGFPRETTPVIDGLAETGVRYENAFSTAPWTLPSHASLFTGLYPTEARATSETLHLPQYVTTLAERMSDAGYRARAAVANPWVCPERGFDRGFEEFVETWRAPLRRPPVVEPLEWIRESKESGKPFFVFLNFNTPHLPYNPRPEFRKRFVSAGRDPVAVGRLARLYGTYEYYVGKKRLEAEEIEILRELYAAEVASVDTMLGRIFGALRDAGMFDDTLIVVVGDHGENIGDHGHLGHFLSMHETLLRIPLVVRYPKRFPSGEVVTDLVSLIDVLPTVLDASGIAGTPASAHIGRRSLCSPERERREFVIAENGRPVTVLDQLRKHFPEFDTAALDHRTRTIRNDRHKLIWRVGEGTELYDLRADPEETKDLAGTRPEIERDLRAKLEAWAKSHPAIQPVGEIDVDDPEALERLRALGYIR
ncbi:MAG: sulfatase [Planctomycetota bacterium]